MSIADCVEELLEDNITVKYFTTDCDSRANAAAGDCYKRHQKEHSPPRHLKDTHSYSVDAIISCYQGNHASCSKHSFMCDGDKNKWEAPFLKKDTIIKCTKKDEASLRNCLNYRLGRQILTL